MFANFDLFVSVLDMAMYDGFPIRNDNRSHLSWKPVPLRRRPAPTPSVNTRFWMPRTGTREPSRPRRPQNHNRDPDDPLEAERDPFGQL